MDESHVIEKLDAALVGYRERHESAYESVNAALEAVEMFLGISDQKLRKSVQGDTIDASPLGLDNLLADLRLVWNLNLNYFLLSLALISLPLVMITILIGKWPWRWVRRLTKNVTLDPNLDKGV